jgi:hypothetical protein
MRRRSSEVGIFTNPSILPGGPQEGIGQDKGNSAAETLTWSSDSCYAEHRAFTEQTGKAQELHATVHVTNAFFSTSNSKKDGCSLLVCGGATVPLPPGLSPSQLTLALYSVDLRYHGHLARCLQS